MTKKPAGLAGIAPPSRKAAIPSIETTHAKDLKPLNARVTSDRATYVRMLSAKTDIPMRELIERAIDLLREEAGEI